MRRIIREAQPSDMADIMKVMDAAKMIMRQSGNMYQWGDGYPSEAVITADMERNGGFIPNRSLGPISSGDVKVFSCPPESKECLALIHGSHKT